MNDNEPRSLNRRQAITAVLVIAAVTSFAGWAWWNGAGPFREKLPPQKPPVEVDLLDGVKYMSTSVHFESFADFRVVQVLTKPVMRYPDWTRRYSDWTSKGSRSLPPYVKSSDRVFGERVWTKEEVDESQRINREFTKALTDAVFAEGFRMLPYRTPEQEAVSALSHARISTRIKTVRQDNLVVFQMETSLNRVVNVDFRKPTPVDVNLTSHTSYMYVVEEKKALEVMKETLRSEAKQIFSSVQSRRIPNDSHQIQLRIRYNDPTYSE